MWVGRFGKIDRLVGDKGSEALYAVSNKWSSSAAEVRRRLTGQTDEGRKRAAKKAGRVRIGKRVAAQNQKASTYYLLR